MFENVFIHYRREERPFIQRMMELANRVSSRHTPCLTSFLDPRQIRIATNIARTVGDVAVFTDGGWIEAERRRVLLAPDYWALEPAEMELSWLRISVAGDYVNLKHGDYLGALIGLGVKREKVGDLSVHEDGCDLVITNDIEDFFLTQLNQVGRASVTVQLISKEQFRPPNIQMMIREFTVMSLRVDAIAAEGFQLSRNKIIDPIKNGKLQLNWQVIENPSVPIEEGDVISLRGMGRLRILEIGGQTKKGRTVVRVGKYL